MHLQTTHYNKNNYASQQFIYSICSLLLHVMEYYMVNTENCTFTMPVYNHMCINASVPSSVVVSMYLLNSGVETAAI